jgi:ATP-binding cassette, subfamily B (MDR/TAP), member 1
LVSEQDAVEPAPVAAQTMGVGAGRTVE